MESISQTVSHFASAIEFSEADFVLAKAMSRDMAHASCLGPPPDDLKAVHTPALVNAWEAKLRRCLSQPVEVEQGDGYRRVQVLGSAIFDFEQDGTVSAYVWAFEDANSSTKCNRTQCKGSHFQAVEHLVGSAVAQTLARSVIQRIHRVIDLDLADFEQVGLFGKELA